MVELHYTNEEVQFLQQNLVEVNAIVQQVTEAALMGNWLLLGEKLADFGCLQWRLADLYFTH